MEALLLVRSVASDVPLFRLPPPPLLLPDGDGVLRHVPFPHTSASALPLPPAAPAPRLRRPRAPRPPLHPADPAPAVHSHSQKQYVGNFCAAVWNAQGLCARSACRHGSKMRYVERLMASRDFVLVTESHATLGAAAALRLPPGVRGFFSPGTSRRAGVAVLIKESFLSNFDPARTSWEVLLPGRCSILHLDGMHGALDIVVCYFATGTSDMVSPSVAGGVQSGMEMSIRRQRRDLRQLLARRCSPASEVLTVLGGDFNWVVQHRDRWSKQAGAFSGHRDAAEERHWSAAVAVPLRLTELLQPMATHENAGARSRIDRVYTNMAVSEQLDRNIACSVLEWVPQLSAHRAVAFSRVAPTRPDFRDRPVPLEVSRHKEWPARVAWEFWERIRRDPDSTHPLRRLKILKQAMRTVADHMMAAKSKEVSEMLGQEDPLGWTIRFIRAVEGGWEGTRRKCLQAYPTLRTLVPDPLHPSLALGDGLRRIRDHAITLAREAAVQALETLHQQASGLDDDQVQSRRGRIHKMLQRVSPGRSNVLAAIQRPDGTVTTDADEMHSLLRSHWRDVFCARPIRRDVLGRWVRDEMHSPGPRLPDPGDPCWAIGLKEVKTALRKSPNSAPGPDGLTFAAWRGLGRLAEECLHAALHSLMDTNAPQQLDVYFGDDFNLGLLVLIPKKPAGVLADGEVFYSPADVRPLSVVSCDNRILANAVRLKLEPIFGAWVSPMQRGFLPGRSMIANIVDVDEEMMHTALRGGEPGAVFFDFAAAFPSISHDYLLEVLVGIGVPPPVMNFIRTLYSKVMCVMVVAGSKRSGFEMLSGIRQGCPLSPLLYAVVGDLYLRRLQRLLPQSMVRAYADDLAVLPRSLMSCLVTMQPFFLELEEVSGLRVNVRKSVVIPLGDYTLEQAAAAIAAACPGWGGLVCSHSAQYLGFTLGPEAGDASWDGPFRKVLQRAASWGRLPLGLQLAAAAYSVHVISTCMFVAQLSAVPAHWAGIERRALARMVRGPGNWCSASDLHLLKRGYAFPREFPDLLLLAKACMLRTLQWENHAEGGLRIGDRAQSLRTALTATEEIVRRGRWAAWFDKSFILTLERNRQSCREHGVRCSTLLRTLSQGAQRPWPLRTMEQVRHGFQKQALAALQPPCAAEVHARLRMRLERWRLPIFPRRCVSRALQVLEHLAKLVPPRVHAAVLRLWWNGWITPRRFQQHAQRCLFCGLDECNDDLEHVSCCRVIWAFSRRFLRRDSPPGPAALRRAAFFLLDQATLQEEASLILGAIRVGAAYRIHNLLRTSTASFAAATIEEMLAQAARDCVRGHSRASRCLDAVWCNS